MNPVTPAKKKIVPILFLALIFMPMCLGPWAYGHTHQEQDTSAAPAAIVNNLQSPGVTERLGDRVDVDAIVRNEEGSPVRFGDLLTLPTILLPIYYSCPSVCNFLQANVAKILPDVDLVPGKEYKVLSLSFDHTETPEIARQARTDFLSMVGKDWPPSAWRFLTGDKKDIESIMDSIGFQFHREEDRFVHPVVIVALAPGGKIVRYLYGYNPLPFDFTMALTEAAEGRQGLSIKRALTYCFSYDPEGKRYSLNVLRIAGIAVVGLALALLLALTLGGRKKGRKKKQLPP